jgi:hypothetical protein
MSIFDKNRKITGGLMLGVVALLVIWDVVVFFTGPNNDTESHMILQFATKHFTLPFAMSGLLGHWFWPRENPPFGVARASAFFAVVVPVMLGMALLDVFYPTPGWMLPMIAPVGYVFGSLFWPQRKLK